MSHGGVAPRRPDQYETSTPRTVQPGGRATQVTNSKTAPLTVQIINKPGNPVVVQDGGVLNVIPVQAYANDGATVNLLNPGVLTQYQLWTLTISSLVATASGAGVVQTNDVVQLSTGAVLGALVNGLAGTTGQSAQSAFFDLKGVLLTLTAIEQLQLVAGTTGYTHRVSAVLGYTIV